MTATSTLYSRSDEAKAEPDGYIVSARKLAAGSVVPPYRFKHWLQWYPTVEEAARQYADLENGEFEGWQPRKIYPAINGLPQVDRALSPSKVARLVQEEV